MVAGSLYESVHYLQVHNYIVDLREDHGDATDGKVLVLDSIPSDATRNNPSDAQEYPPPSVRTSLPTEPTTERMRLNPVNSKDMLTLALRRMPKDAKGGEGESNLDILLDVLDLVG